MKNKYIDSITIPKPAWMLGYMGLLPFVALSIALWFVNEEYTAVVSNSLFLYAAIILSFMGAIYWGVAIADSNKPDAKLLGYSVIPALVAWFASFASTIISFSLIYLAFAGLCMLDSVTSKRGDLPAWYPFLRVPLTMIVIASLITAQLAIVFR